MKARTIQFLKWSEKYTKTDMVYLASGGTWSMLSALIQISLGIISTVILANILSKDELGTYQFILAAGGLLGSLTITGMGTAMISTVAQGHDGGFLYGVKTKLRFSIAIPLVAFGIATYYFINDNLGLTLAFTILGLCVPLIESYILYESYLQGKKAFRDMVILGIWRKPLPIAAVLLTLYFTTNVIVLVFVYFISLTLATLLVYRRVIAKYQPSQTPHKGTARLGKQLSIVDILFRIAEHFDKVLLWYLLNPAAVAIFALAHMASKYTGGIIASASAIALPKVAQRDLLTLKKTLPRKLFLYFLVLIPITSIYIIAIPYVFTFLLPAYPESIPFAQVLSILILFTPINIISNVLTAHQQIKSIYVGGTINALIRLTLMFVLISLYGIWGAVYALIASEVVGFIIGWYLFMTARPVPPPTTAH